MSSMTLQAIRAHVKEHGEIPIELDLGYTVVYSTLQGNFPINNRVTGSILNFPVNLRLDSMVISNTSGSLPVNTRLSGMIGDTQIRARLKHRMAFSTIAGNIPINTALVIPAENAEYRLRMETTYVTGSAIGAAKGDGGGKKGKVTRKFIGGQLREVEGTGGGGGIPQEAGRPLISAIHGRIEDVVIDLRMQYTYYCDTSSGRSPINVRAIGFLRDASR